MPTELGSSMGTSPRLDGAGHRHASVTLRAQGGAEDTGPMLDPANQSLAETLGIVFRVLQFGMLALLAAFAISGLGKVNQNERGLRLLFGNPTARDLMPGLQFSAPYPMGELVKVDMGSVSLNIDNAFWPNLTDDQKKFNFNQLATIGKGSLKPGEDGSLLTGDENIAHSKWTVHYTRARPGDYIQDILTDDEQSIVRASVERGIVLACAQVPVDTLLKQSTTDQGSVARTAQKLAQGMLDDMKAGIQIDQLTLSAMTPPFLLLNDFSNVQSAEQKASQQRDQAQTEARQTLNAMAGAAHDALIHQIDLFEQAVTRNDADEQSRVLGTIDQILDGKEIKVGDQTVPANAVAGEVTNLLADARQYRSSIVSQRMAELDSFKAKLVQFKSNPDVVVKREWADAMAAFLDHPNVEIFNIPAGVQNEFWLNRDASFVKDFEKQQKADQIKKEDRQRQLEMEQDRFKTRTDQSTLKTR